MSLAARWFVLKNTHGDFATVQAALATADAAKFGGTWNQTSRVCSFDATLTIIGSLVTDAELTGDLAPLARANEGTGVFIHELRNQAHKDIALFDYLGESGYTAYFVKQNWAQAAQGATPTSVSTGTGGRTFADAVAWEDYESIVSRVTDPIRVWFHDDQIAVANSGFSAAPASINFDSGTDASNRNEYRFDPPGHRGCTWEGLLLGSHVTWTDEGQASSGTGHIWSCTLPVNCFEFGFCLDPGFDGSGNATPGEYGTWLVTRASEALLNANQYSVWASAYTSGNTLKVHLPAGENPANRVMIAGGGKTFGNISTLHDNMDFYEVKRRMTVDLGQWVIDGANFYRGLNSEVGYDTDGLISTGGTWWCPYINLDSTARWGTGQSYTGWFIEGFRCRNAVDGFLYNNQLNTNSMSGIHIQDVDGEEIGGFDLNQGSTDGHVIGFQGGAANVTIDGTFRAYRTGNPINCYAFTQNDINPTLVVDQGFPNLTIDISEGSDGILMQDHSEFFSDAGGNDVGLHLTGDADITGDFTGVSITMDGEITGFARPIRVKWPCDVQLTASAADGLILSKGSQANSTTGIFSQVSAQIYEVALTSPTGNWNVGDKLADPATPANAIALITRVVDANTLQFRGVSGSAPYFSDTDTITNMDDTGSATANGDAALQGRVSGYITYSNVKFSSDLDEAYHSATVDSPAANASVRNAIGMHVKASNNKYVGTPVFNTLHGSAQGFAAWKTNSDAAGDNAYDTTGSTNPSS